MAEHDQLIGSLISRVNSFRRLNDPAIVLASDVARDIGRLGIFLSPLSILGAREVLKINMTLADTYFARCVAEPGPAWTRHLAPAIEHYRQAYLLHQDVIKASINRIIQIESGNLDRPVARWHPTFANRVALALDEWSIETGSVLASDKAVALFRSAIAGLRPADADLFGIQANLAGALHQRYVKNGNRADLDEQIDLLRQAHGNPIDQKMSAVVANNLGIALQARYNLTRNVNDLTAAVDVARDTVRLAGTRPPAPFLHLLFSVTMEAVGRLAEPADELVRVAEQLVAATGPRTPEYPLCLVKLALALHGRSNVTGDHDDLDEAVRLYEQAISLTRDPDERRSFESTLTEILKTRFKARGARADIDRAVATYRRVVARDADSPRQKPDRLMDLGSALLIRYEAFGNSADLDEGLRHCQDAVESARQVHSDPLVVLSSGVGPLATGLVLRFRRYGQRSDIESAIELRQRALTVLEQNNQDYAGTLCNLGSDLRERYTAFDDESDLRTAVRYFRLAFEHVRQDAHELPSYESHLASGLVELYEIDGDLPVLDEAIDLLRHAVEHTATGHPHLAMYSNDLGGTLRRRIAVDSNGQEEYLAEAIAVHRRALDCIGPHHFDRAMYTLNLASALGRRYELTTNQADATEAFSLAEQAYAMRTAPTSTRILAAVFLADAACLEQDWIAATRAYRKAVQLLPRLAWLGLDRGSQEDHLHRWSSLGADAAVCAIAAGDTVAAAEMLEHTRGILWNQQLSFRTELTVLEQVVPDIAARLKAIRQALDHGTGAAGADLRMQLAQEWDSLVEQVRQIRGFEHVDSPVPYDQMLAAASDGAIVMINVHAERCDALVITAGADRPQLIELPDLTATEAVNRANRFLGLMSEETLPYESRREVLTTTLEWLWRTCVRKILDKLGLRTPIEDNATGPRLWWCATGVLTVLPLHAAGLYAADGGSTVYDRVIASYTPTVAALIRAQQQPRTTVPIKLLTVSTSETSTGHQKLEYARAEREKLTEVCGPHTQLVDAEATIPRMLQEIGKHQWLHLACHATTDMMTPANGAVHLYDDALTILQLATSENRVGGEAAFLSACHTALTGFLPDEVVHLAAAFQASGDRHVVATQWHALDPYTPIITADIYQQAGLDATALAASVRNTVQGLRRKKPDHILAWAPYVHIGP